MHYTLSLPELIRPRHEIDQEEILDWIARAHAKASGEDAAVFRNKLNKLGLGKERIARRGIQINDLYQQFDQMEITYRGFTEKSSFYDREVSQIFEQFYPEKMHLPDHLIHVTCTGYVAPSPAQKVVSLRGAGAQTVVTHAYHMGCYGAIAGTRIGLGLAADSPSTKIDIVHTEVCSLHIHPYKHSSEQLLVQSLFSDGFIKYRLQKHGAVLPYFKILALREELIPDSAHCMTWKCETQGLGMTLSKEVPVRIVKAIEGYLGRLCENLNFKDALFAIHPGGPKILNQMQERLNLSPFQIEHSVNVLKCYGNMSSATLPHIWHEILKDPKIAKGTPVVSLAFGPGLNIAGALFEKG